MLPAHEYRFADLGSRIDEITAHHADRLEEIVEVIRARPGSNGLGDHPRTALVAPVGRDRAVHATSGQRRDHGPLRAARTARPDPSGRRRPRPASSSWTPRSTGGRQGPAPTTASGATAVGAATLGVLAVVVIVVVVVTASGARRSRRRPPRRLRCDDVDGSPRPRRARCGRQDRLRARTRSRPASTPWQLPAAVSREAVVATRHRVHRARWIWPRRRRRWPTVYTVDPANGAVTPGRDVACRRPRRRRGHPRHHHLRGGRRARRTRWPPSSPWPPSPSDGPAGPGGDHRRHGRRPAPLPPFRPGGRHRRRPDTARRPTWWAGTPAPPICPSVLATTDGIHYTTVADLTVPVRYPAVVADDGLLYSFGGETASAGSAATATDAVQVIDPSTHQLERRRPPSPTRSTERRRSSSTGPSTWPAARCPAVRRSTTIYAFVPSTKKVLNAGLLPQAEAFGGYTTVGSGRSAVGYIVGGEVAAQSRPRSGRRGVGHPPVGHVAAAQPLRRPGRRARAPAPPTRGRCSSPTGATTGCWPWTPAATSPGSTRRPPCRHRRAASTSPTTPSSSTGARGSSPTRRTTTPSSRSATRRARSSGSTAIRWSPGSAPGYLNQPDDAYLLKSGTIMVADASNNRILFISPAGQPTGQIGNGVAAHNPPDLHRLPERRHPAGRRQRPGVGDQRLVDRRVHLGRKAGVDRAHARASTTPRTPSSWARTSS